jgi:ferredoxin
MKYKVEKDLCINCGACAAECPVDAVLQDEGAYMINAALCDGCALCVSVCPMDCITSYLN